MEGQRAGIPFIEWLRAIAPALVLWAHIGPAADWLSGNGWPPWTWALWACDGLCIMQCGGHLGVLIFFLVSGFIISHVAEKEPRAEFAIKRVFRIFPMLFAGVIIAYVLSKLSLEAGIGPDVPVSNALLSLFLLDHVVTTQPQLLGVTWTLVTELSFYALMIAFYPQVRRWPVGSTYLLIGALTALQLVLCSILGDRVPAVFFLKQALFIMVGRAAYLAWSGRASTASAVILSVAACAALAASYLLTPYSRSLFFARDSVVFSWLAAVAMFGAAMTLRPGQAPPRVIRFLSNVSYSTYLLHIPVGVLVIALVMKTGVGPTLGFAIGTAAVLLASYLTYVTIELPGQRLGRAAIRATRNHLSRRLQAVPVGNPNGPLTRQQF